MADTKPKSSTAKRTTASKSGSTKSQARTASSSSRGKTASARSGASASRPASRSSAAKKPAAKKPAAKKPAAKKPASSNGRAKSSGSTKRSAATSRSSTPARSAGANGSGHGVVASVKQAATRAKGPALAVGAAAAGLAGGIALKGRGRRKTVLGVPIPKRLPSVDPKALAKSVGEASAQLAKTSKSVSKDIERAGDQAERIGKILK
jgi:hypothetical protein